MTNVSPHIMTTLIVMVLITMLVALVIWAGISYVHHRQDEKAERETRAIIDRDKS